MILTILATIGAIAITAFCGLVIWAAYELRLMGWHFGDRP